MGIRPRVQTESQKEAMGKLMAASWSEAITMSNADSDRFAGLPQSRFTDQMVDKGMPAVKTGDPAITPDVLRAAGVKFNTPAGKADKNGIGFNPDTKEWMVFGHHNLGLMAHHGVEIPEAKLFAEKYEAFLNRIERN